MKKIGISACTLLLLSALLCFASWQTVAATAAAVILHETGHLAAIYLMGEKINHFTVAPWGLNLEFSAEKLSYPKEAFIALGGPWMNFLSFTVAAAMLPGLGEFGKIFCGINLLLGIFNLIPAYPLDGGMILRALLFQYLPLNEAMGTVYWVSLAVGVFLMALGVWICIFTKGNMTVFFTSMVILTFCRTKQLYRIL